MSYILMGQNAFENAVVHSILRLSELEIFHEAYILMSFQSKIVWG